MSVIQKIQEKYAKLMAIIIAVALMIFVVMLAFENGGSLFRGGNSTTVGKVNGTTIDYNDFMRKVSIREKSMERQYAQMGYPTTGIQQQAIENTWNSEVDEIIQQDELNKLGIKVGKKEMGDVLYGNNAPPEWKRLFLQSDSDVFNGNAAKAQIDAMLKRKPTSQDEADRIQEVVDYINSLQEQRLTQKLTSLLSNSVNAPKWFVEKQIADESQLASISVVKEDFANYSKDSTIKVSDKEIQDYIDKHKEDFKQEESRSISYVAFSTNPSAKDSAAAKNKLDGLKTEFDTSKNVEPVLTKQGLSMPEKYVQSSALPISIKDTITKSPLNAVYGPYIENGAYTLAKLLDKRKEPEMVKVRHILISTTARDPQNPQQTIQKRDDAQAKSLADSIQKAIEKGSSFDSLAVKFSDDNPSVEDKKSNKYKFGIYDSVKQGAMVPEFDEFIFGKPAGSKGVVKTSYGYHYIEVLAQEGKTLETYKVAYLPVPIESSTETEINANNDANQFAANSRDQKSFDANAEKLKNERGISKMVSNEIAPAAQGIPGLNQSRALIRNVYKAKLGEVLEPQKAGDSYVVAIVNEINEEGTRPVAKVRSFVEPPLRNKKIAEKIIQKLGNITTLEAASAALGNKPIETIDSLRMIGVQTSNSPIASEPRVVGAAFNPANKGKVVPQAIAGRGAVYVVRVNNVSATSVANANIAERRKMEEAKAQVPSPIETLKKIASIKDRRVNFF